jgi:hypothetical protein
MSEEGNDTEINGEAFEDVRAMSFSSSAVSSCFSR